MYLFFDTETSDLPRNFNAPESDIRNWPHIVQIAWTVGETLETVGPTKNYLIKPAGFRIAPGATEQHGITTDYALSNGSPLRPILDVFLQAVNDAAVIVAHNIDFDVNIVGAECARVNIPNPIRKKAMRCTMKESADHCRIPSRRGFKWPKLTELHQNLFDSGFEDAHDAASDCLACMRCFFRLNKLGVM